MSSYPRVVPFGEGALLVEFGDRPDHASSAAAHGLARALELDPPLGLQARVPGYASLLVMFDPLAPDVTAHVERVLGDVGAPIRAAGGRLRRIPVVYGGDRGPDLEAVASHVGMSPAEVIEHHARDELMVYMLGFAPGHPYIGDLPSEFAAIRRLDTPRPRVPRGSVGVVGRQSVIYPQSTPGGWRIIGQTPIVLWDERREPPAYFAPGDRVQFVPIGVTDWERHSGPPADW